MPKKLRPASRKTSAPAIRVTRPPMERMWRIHQKVTEGDYPNCQTMGRDLEVSAKTVMRDVEFMRDRLGLPLAYESVRHGFYYTSPVRDFPVMKVSQGEVAALLLAQKSLEQFRGTPFEKPLSAAFRKLTDSLGSEMEVTWHELEDALSVRTGGVGISDMQIFDALAKAVTAGDEISLLYHKLAGDHAEPRTVRPYHLGCIENQWYLFAHDTGRGAVRTFALPRISHVERTGGKFRRPKNFSLAKILDGSFAVFEGGRACSVKLRFRGVAARLVGERIWHPTQKLTSRPGGAVDLEMRVGITPDLRQWILGWGPEIEALEPRSLAAEIAELAERTAKVYRASVGRKS